MLTEMLHAVLWYSGHVYKSMVQRSVHARYIDTNVCAKQKLAYMLPLRHNKKYFVKYQNIVLEIQRMVLCMENVRWKIFRDTC
jgi:hypothetical protein